MSRDTATTRFVARLSRSARGCEEVHQQKHGNMNYVLVFRLDDGRNGKTTVHDGGAILTVFTKDASCGRGEYAEELDVQLGTNHPRGLAEVKRIAQAVLDSSFYTVFGGTSALRISKIVRRW